MDCCVKVAVHIRPLSEDERLKGCKDCVTVTPGKPQVQIGTHCFSYDHIYDSTGSPSSAMFNECVYPLVDGLFKGYNATVLAYGQTGSGKTYIMGTGFKDGFRNGLVPQVMNALFGKIATLKDQCECHLLVSFIEIHNDEVIDLLDTTSKPGLGNGTAARAVVPGKALIQIRESSDGVIRLAGSTEVSVNSLNEMEACLEQGRLNRATGSTNMNNQSSRSHAIFTITLKQLWKHRVSDNMGGSSNEEYLCAKWHLVDLAGSERVKRTGSDGLRFTEGVHINKGLLALGKVISALGDKSVKEFMFRIGIVNLLGFCRILLVEIAEPLWSFCFAACISPADINAEETLNTLKYANRTRNIQNKPVVNRGTISCEVLKLRQQLEVLQAELSARGERSQQKQVQDLKERIGSLEAQNESLSQQLHVHRSRYAGVDYDPATFQDDARTTRSEGLKRGFPDHDYIENQMSEITGEIREVDQEKKEGEHKHVQNSLDTELDELNTRIQQKESEMKLLGGLDSEALKQHYRRKVMDLENEKRAMQQDRDRSLAETESRPSNNDPHAHKLKLLEAQMIPTGTLSMKKMAAGGQQTGKLWSWKRNHQQFLLMFKWKWEKPWKVSEWIKHSDETIMRARPPPSPQAF